MAKFNLQVSEEELIINFRQYVLVVSADGFKPIDLSEYEYMGPGERSGVACHFFGRQASRFLMKRDVDGWKAFLPGEHDWRPVSLVRLDDFIDPVFLIGREPAT